MNFRLPARLIPAVSIVLLGACAHQPMASTPEDKGTAVSEHVTPNIPGLYSQDEFPEWTPVKMAQRFLRFIDSLDQYDRLTLEHLEQVMQLKLDGEEGSHHKQFNIHMHDSDWYYATGYSEQRDYSHQKSVMLNFGHGQDRDRADMAPVCGLYFDDYFDALQAMGFEEREDMAQYEHAHYVPVMNEHGETVSTLVPGRRRPMYYFSRGDVGVTIRYRAETVEPESTRRRACVLNINVGAAAPKRTIP